RRQVGRHPEPRGVAWAVWARNEVLLREMGASSDQIILRASPSRARAGWCEVEVRSRRGASRSRSPGAPPTWCEGRNESCWAWRTRRSSGAGERPLLVYRRERGESCLSPVDFSAGGAAVLSPGAEGGVRRPPGSIIRLTTRRGRVDRVG